MPENLHVLVVSGQVPQPRQQRRNRRTVGQRFKGCKPLLPLLLQAAELQLRAMPHPEVRPGEGLLLPLPAPAAKQHRGGFSFAGGSVPVAPGGVHPGGRQHCQWGSRKNVSAEGPNSCCRSAAL